MSALGPWQGGGGGGGGGRGLEPWLGSPLDMWDPFGRGRDDSGAAAVSVMSHAHVDWRETDTAHIFTADLPGVKKEEVKVQVEDNNVLAISGERTMEAEDSGNKWHRKERRRGTFMRRFRLPENAETDAIRCGLDHGVLTVTVPKKDTQEAPSRNVRHIDVA